MENINYQDYQSEEQKFLMPLEKNKGIDIAFINLSYSVKSYNETPGSWLPFKNSCE